MCKEHYSWTWAHLQDINTINSHWIFYHEEFLEFNAVTHDKYPYVAVLGRNGTLFRCVFWPRYRIRSAVVHTYVKGGAHTRYVDLLGIDAAHMSPALNGSIALQHFKCGNMVEIRNGITSDFYPGLPHMYNWTFLAYTTKLQIFKWCWWRELWAISS